MKSARRSHTCIRRRTLEKTRWRTVKPGRRPYLTERQRAGPVRDTITASFEPADTAQDANEVKIMNVTQKRLQQLSRYLQKKKKKKKRRVKLFLKLSIFNTLIILEPVTLPSATECHDSSLTISSHRGPHKATRGRFKPVYDPNARHLSSYQGLALFRCRYLDNTTSK